MLTRVRCTTSPTGRATTPPSLTNRVVHRTKHDVLPYGEPTIEPTGQRYLFGGKEREHAGGRNSYDFGARCLTPYGNWGVVDRYAEKFYPISPYSYCGGDPTNHIDKDGNVLETIWDIGNVFYDIYAAVDAHIDGDHERAKQHWIDAGVDVISAAIPGVPAGISKAAKVVDNAVDVSKAVKVSSKTAKEIKQTSSTIKSLRRKAVKHAWKDEQILVKKTGKGTRKWTSAERKELQDKGKVKGYQGHHINNVKDHPNMAGDLN